MSRGLPCYWCRLNTHIVGQLDNRGRSRYLVDKMRKLWEKRLHDLVGDRVRRAREGAAPRVTQHQLAARTDGAVSRSSIANIEKGRQGMYLFQLYAIADALGVEATVLLPQNPDVFGTLPRTALQARGVTAADAPWVERVFEKRESENQQ